jgi:ferredoxin-NADP reductase
MKNDAIWLDAVVITAQDIADGVRRIEFAGATPLPAFDPGSHIAIRTSIATGHAIRTYSCLPDAAPGHVAVGVKLHPNSRGGSRFMFGLRAGEEVRITTPENRFELSWRAPDYLLLAGGIGVTPIFAMAQALTARGADVRMEYGGQNLAAMPFIEPLPMLEAAKRAWAKAGRPVSRLRYEVFGDTGRFTEAPFTVSVTGYPGQVTVPPDRSLLDALSDAGIPMIHDCRRGECGLCAVEVLSHDGEIDHRDVFLSEAEKAEGKRLCACVSRIAGGHAVIDTGYRA